MPYVVTLENTPSDWDVHDIALRIETPVGAADLCTALCESLVENMRHMEVERGVVGPYVAELQTIADALAPIMFGRAHHSTMPMVDHAIRLDEAGCWSLALDGPVPRLRLYPTR